MYRFVVKHIDKIVKIPKVEDNHLNLLSEIKIFMHLYQLWPKTNKTFLSWCRFLGFLTFVSFITASCIGHFIQQTVHKESRNFVHMIISLSVMLGSFAAYQFMPTFFASQHRSRRLAETLGDFTSFPKPPGIEISEAIMNAICRTYFISLYCLAPVLYAFKLKEHCPDEEDMICGFVFPTYFPGLMTSGRRKVVLTFQIITTFNGMLMGFGILWFFLQMSNVIVLYLKNLNGILKDVGLIEEWSVRQERARDAIKYHHHIISMYDEFFDLCKGIFVIYATWIPVVIGLMTYSLTVEFNIQFFSVYFLWTTALIITCIFGQNIITESEKVAYISYMSMPTDGDMITSKILTMMIMRSQRPMFLPAGSFTYCGYSMIVTVAQTTYSYLTLLRTTDGSH